MAFSNAPLVNWQQKFKTWKDRIAHITQRTNLADFKFIVGPNKTVFHGHKLIFAISSPEFENLFYGLNSPTSREVVLSNTQPEIFTDFFNFIYTGNIELNSNNFEEIFRLAKLYAITILVDLCKQFLEDSVKKDNALNLLELSGCNKNYLLEQKCLKVIGENAIDVFKGPEFTSISKISLGKILDSGSLSCKEINIFEAVNKWSEKTCERNQLSVTSITKKLCVGDLFDKINFGTMTPTEAVKCSHVENSFLTSNELAEILQFIKSPLTNFGFYSKIKRFGQLPLLKSLRFIDGPVKTTGCSLGGKLDINISVNRVIYLCGYGVFGGKPESLESYSNAIIQTKLSDQEGKVLSENSDKITFDGTERIYDIFFKQPVLIAPFKKYNIWVKRNGPHDVFQNFKGVTGKKEIKENGLVIRITKSLDESFPFNTAAEGPIAAIFYKIC